MNKLLLPVVFTLLLSITTLPQISYADHGSVTKTIDSSNTQVSFRDIDNTGPQSLTIILDKLIYSAGENVMVTATEADANIDLDNIDMISVSATTPSGFNKLVLVSETDKNTGVFTSIFNLDNVAPPEELTVTGTPEPNGVGRFFADFSGISGSGTVEISDLFINAGQVDCSFTLVTQPIRIEFSVVTVDDITVTMSYANGATPTAGTTPASYHMLYAPFVPGGVTFQFVTLTGNLLGNNFFGTTVDLTGHSDLANTLPELIPKLGNDLKRITNLIQPENADGLYAIGYVDNACPGGNGGGLLTPGMEVSETSQIIKAMAVGGELIPVDNVSLVLAYGLVNSWWMAPIGIGIGVGIYLVKRKIE